jgi:hypothetical protein
MEHKPEFPSQENIESQDGIKPIEHQRENEHRQDKVSETEITKSEKIQSIKNILNAYYNGETLEGGVGVDIEKLQGLLTELESQVQAIETSDVKPQGWEKIKQKIGKITRRTIRTAGTLAAMGGIFMVVNHEVTRYDVKEAANSEGKIEYKHEDDRTTHYLNCIAGKDTLTLQDVKDFYLPGIAYYAEKSGVALDKPIDEMTTGEINELWVKLGILSQEEIETGWGVDSLFINEFERSQKKIQENPNQVSLEDAYRLVWELESECGNPKIRFTTEDIGFTPISDFSESAHFDPLTNTIYIEFVNLIPSNNGAVFAELSHGKQFHEKPYSEVFHFMQDVLTMVKDSGFNLKKMGKEWKKKYNTPGTVEHDAHSVIEPYLERKYQFYKSKESSEDESN